MPNRLSTTPKADGFFMPAEYAAHHGCWMLWPERPDVWRDGAKPAQRVFAQVAEAISRSEAVTVGVSRGQYRHARAMLAPQVRVVELSSDDAWMRDMGPSFVVNDQGELRGVDWGFNAWGGLLGGAYFPWDQDALVAQKVLELEQIPRYVAPLIMEGGALHVDGQGTALVTESCLLHPNRNPHLSKAEIEAYLMEYLGVEVVIWLGEGVYNDETDGHIDNLACFLRGGAVALTWTDDPHDPQYERSQAAYDTLRAARDAQGRALEVYKLHQPDPLYITEEEAAGIDHVDTAMPRPSGQRMAASYVNFYIANGGIIVPTFDDARHDAPACQTLAECFPEREIIPIYAREILLGGGNIHCITQQQPRRN